MKPLQHLLFSTMFFGVLYTLGFESNFVVTAFAASILIDLDHFFLAGRVGSWNPLQIYRFCVNFNPELREILVIKFGGIRFLPFHNVLLALLVTLFFPSIGVGMLFHLALDFISILRRGH